MQVVYDGSLEGFLSIVYEYYYFKLRPTSIVKSQNQTLFNEDTYLLKTDVLRAKRVFDGMKKHFLKEQYHTILTVFSCDSVKFEDALLRYIIMGFRDKKSLFNLHVKTIRDIEAWKKAYVRELHRWCGFARFQELDSGLLYAKFEPKYSLLSPLGRHFSRRLGNHDFILHDSLRSQVLLCFDGSISLQNVHEVSNPRLAEDENKISSLWRTFFNHVAIKERLNRGLQQQFVPLRCQAFMSEFEALHVSADTKIWEDATLVHKWEGVKTSEKTITFKQGTL